MKKVNLGITWLVSIKFTGQSINGLDTRQTQTYTPNKTEKSNTS